MSTALGATQAVEVYQDVLYSGHHAHDCSSMGEFPDQPRYHLFAQSVNDPKLLGWFPNTNDGLGEALAGEAMIAVSTDTARAEAEVMRMAVDLMLRDMAKLRLAWDECVVALRFPQAGPSGAGGVWARAGRVDGCPAGAAVGPAKTRGEAVKR